ncbi:hypothetical protein S83_065005 [Arachis hypogaea]
MIMQKTMKQMDEVWLIVPVLISITQNSLRITEIFNQIKSAAARNIILGKHCNSIKGSELESKQRRYSFNEVVEMTNNFDSILGRGGFGTVYHGFIGDIQVAVKMLSLSSVHGYQQFVAEEKTVGKSP